MRESAGLHLPGPDDPQHPAADTTSPSSVSTTGTAVVACALYRDGIRTEGVADVELYATLGEHNLDAFLTPSCERGRRRRGMLTGMETVGAQLPAGKRRAP